jgi:hypothetical protein
MILDIANRAVEAKKWKRPYTDSTQYCREIYDQQDHFIVAYLRLENGELAHQVGGSLSVVIRKDGLAAIDVVREQ